MEAKLKSVINKIHWSLFLKSLIIAGGWFILPFWLFILLVLFFYFILVFQPFSLLFPFLIFIFLSKLLSIGFWSGLVIFILIFLILGIKDLIIIHRGLAYEILGYIFLIVLSLKFFENFGENISSMGLVLGFLLALFYFLFFKKIFFYEELNLDIKKFKIFLAVLSFFVLETIWVLVFLPLNFYLQTSILMLVSVLGLEIILNHCQSNLNKKFIALNLLVFTLFFLLVLFLNNWRL